MSVASFLAAAAVPTLGGMGAAGGLGAFRWLSKLTGVTTQLGQVAADLKAVSENQAATAREARSLRRDLTVHLRSCPPPRDPYAGEERRRARRIPAPAPAGEE